MRLGYRARLAAWHTIVLGIILGLLVGGLDWTVHRIILDQFDAALLHAAQSVGAEIDEEGPTSPGSGMSTKPVRRLLWSFRPIVQVVARRGGIVARLSSDQTHHVAPDHAAHILSRRE